MRESQQQEARAGALGNTETRNVSKQQAGLPILAELLRSGAHHERWWTLPHCTIASVCWIHTARRAVARPSLGQVVRLLITQPRTPLQPFPIVAAEVAISTLRAPNSPQQQEQPIAGGVALWLRSES